MDSAGKTLVGQASFNQALKILLPYQERVYKTFGEALYLFGDDSELRKACSYAMQSGGKRLRPAIVWMIAEGLHSKANVDLAALAVEFFHISSLVTDDLPCMDNDDFRRGIPTTHKTFSEATALLASFALTAAGFDALSKLTLDKECAYDTLKLLIEKASRAIGAPGLIGGQYLDLNPPLLTKEKLEEIFDRKTCVLFDLAFSFGWILGGGKKELLPEVTRLATCFGRAFQIVDDIEDMKQDAAVGKKINYALCFGINEAKQEVGRLIDQFYTLSQKLGLQESPLVTLTLAMQG
jgi:geranylgeranyl diphosphate synthase type II